MLWSHIFAIIPGFFFYHISWVNFSLLITINNIDLNLWEKNQIQNKKTNKKKIDLLSNRKNIRQTIYHCLFFIDYLWIARRQNYFCIFCNITSFLFACASLIFFVGKLYEKIHRKRNHRKYYSKFISMIHNDEDKKTLYTHGLYFLSHFLT